MPNKSPEEHYRELYGTIIVAFQGIIFTLTGTIGNFLATIGTFLKTR